MSGIWLVRHGMLPPNPERRMVGARDIPLSAEGREQIRLLAQQFMPKVQGALGAVICSDLDRCRETAAILLEALPHGRPPQHVEPGLREIDLGLWQGMTKAEIERAWPGAYAARGQDMAHFCPPQGESFMQAQRRALAAVARWRRLYPGATLLMVSHAGILGSLLAHYMALPLRDVLRIPQYYGCSAFVPEW
ncbi:MAG: histidine phosphatase family protein [Desulfovibrio sp.]